MKDKEVGEFWALYKTMEHDPVHLLICKLVEERACHKFRDSFWDGACEEDWFILDEEKKELFRNRARAEFGIY